MKNKTRILVTGAGGFIGHHLVTRLKKEGHWVRGADLKLPQYETSHADEFEILDLRRFEDCLLATRGGIDQVYNLAADMGGIGFITANHAELARNNILINAHMLEASRVQNVGRFLFSSSACVYAQSKQRDTQVTSLKESDAFPADPEPGYGWEKLYAEQLCLYFRDAHRSFSQCVRAAGNIRWRPRESSRRGLPQSGAGVRRWDYRYMGRWKADALFHVRG
jgi:GDP-D-mannose 3',5'-epimerase